MDAIAEELIARLRRNPEDHAAYAALRAHYQRVGDYASLINLLEGWAGRSPDHAASAQALFDAGELAWGLADTARASSLYEKALERNPAHHDAWARLEQLLQTIGDVRRLAEQMEKRAEGLVRIGADAREAAALHHRLGELWEQSFARVDKAILHYRKAFELDATLVPAIYAAREIYRKAGNLKAAATLCELEAKAETDPDRRIALLRELAHMRFESLNDLEGSVAALKRALSQAPQSTEVMEDLARIYLARAERSNDPHVQDSDRKRAADVLFQLAQRLPPAQSVPLLEQALDAAPDHEQALSLLERIAEQVGDPRMLPTRWVAFLARAPEAPTARVRRRRLAHAYLEAGQSDYAIQCLEWLLDEGDADAASELVELYRQAGREEDSLRALAVAAQHLPPEQRIGRLREMISIHVARGETEAAVAQAKAILELDPEDPEAFALLEDDCRRRGAWNELRETLLRATRAPGLSLDGRKQRLREVAQLSEHRMSDAAGAIAAYRGLSTLDPGDHDARVQLIRLLEATEGWDELVEVLDREALAQTDAGARAAVYRRLADVHRHKRSDPAAAVVVLRSLLDVAPGDRAAETALGQALVLSGQVDEALYYLEADVQHAPAGARRAEALRALGRAQDALGDFVSSFDAWARLLQDATGDREALERMEAIDQEEGGDPERLLRTLGYRAEIEEADAKAEVLVRMGRLAEERLEDLDRAAELYGRALEIAPKDESVLDDLSRVYDRAERYKDLVVLLRERARTEADGAVRQAIWRRVARTLAERIQNPDAASEAWQKVLEDGEDREALEFLRAQAEEHGRLEDAQGLLGRIAKLATEMDDRREVMRARARLLAEGLERPRDAITVLREIVHEVDANHLITLGELGDLEEAVGDVAGQADTLERTLAVLEDDGLRVPIAKRLAGLYEDELKLEAKAIDALGTWSEADLGDPEPLRRLVPLLERASRIPELLTTYDSLADIEEDDAAISAAVRAGAELAYKRLGDVNGAWDRLVPRVSLGDAAAEAQLRELAQGAERGKELAELYVELAGQGDDPSQQARRWMDAAEARERLGKDPAAALEAVLRAFALELTNERYLAEADRLAALASAWPRLGQVYETLLRKTEDKDAKKRLLLRHAKILEEHGGDASGAFDRVLRACAAAPADDAVLAEAERLAPLCGRSEDLLVVYDRRRKDAADDAGRIEALLRAARLSEQVLGSREQASLFLGQAVALTVRAPALTPMLEEAVRAASGEPKSESLVAALVDVYAALAEDMDTDPVGAGRLLARAAHLYAEDLDDEPSAYGALVRATSLAPQNDEALDALGRFAETSKREGQLEQHLGRLVEDALDGKVAARLLRRRAVLLAKLGQKGAAAEAWGRLKMLQPNDAEVRELWRAALREAGRHEDVLLALDQEISRNKDKSTHKPLRREQALVWERDLKNRSEAIDAWKKVLALDPEDAEAKEAIARLSAKKTAPGTEVAPSEESAIDELLASPAPSPRVADDLASEADVASVDDVASEAEVASEGDARSVDSIEATLSAPSDALPLEPETDPRRASPELDASASAALPLGPETPAAVALPSAAEAPAAPAEAPEAVGPTDGSAPDQASAPAEAAAAPPDGADEPAPAPSVETPRAASTAVKASSSDSFADETMLADDAAREQAAELDDVVSSAKMPPVAEFGLAGSGGGTGEVDLADVSDVSDVDSEEDADALEEAEDLGDELEDLDVPMAAPPLPPPRPSGAPRTARPPPPGGSGGRSVPPPPPPGTASRSVPPPPPPGTSSRSVPPPPPGRSGGPPKPPPPKR